MRKWLAKEFEKAGFYAELVELIKFPRMKPPAFLQIDDRAITFTGEFPSVDEMKSFKSWIQIDP